MNIWIVVLIIICTIVVVSMLIRHIHKKQCSKLGHDWNYCKCKRCGREQHTWKDVTGGEECEICGMSNYSFVTDCDECPSGSCDERYGHGPYCCSENDPNRAWR